MAFIKILIKLPEFRININLCIFYDNLTLRLCIRNIQSSALFNFYFITGLINLANNLFISFNFLTLHLPFPTQLPNTRTISKHTLHHHHQKHQTNHRNSHKAHQLSPNHTHLTDLHSQHNMQQRPQHPLQNTAPPIQSILIMASDLESHQQHQKVYNQKWEDLGLGFWEEGMHEAAQNAQEKDLGEEEVGGQGVG